MKIHFKNKLALAFGFFLVIILTSFGNSAQGAQNQTQPCRSDQGWCLEVALPGLPSGQPIKEPGQYIRLLYLSGVGVAGVLAVLIIVYAGFQWMTSPAVGTIESAKQMITNAISGIIILLASYLILNTINPDLVSLKMPELEKLTLEKGGIEIDANAVSPNTPQSTYTPEKNQWWGGIKIPASQELISLSRLGIRYQFNNDKPLVDKNAADLLKKINNIALSISPSAMITGGYDGHSPSHSSPSHHIGCAFDFSGFTSCNQVNRFINEAKKAGAFNILNEYAHQLNCGGVWYPTTTGDNIHIEICYVKK